MVPMILIGSYIGVFINVLLPQAVVGVALSFFIIYLCYTTIKKGLKFYKAENEEKKKKLEEAEKLVENGEEPLEKNELYASLKINEDDIADAVTDLAEYPEGMCGADRGDECFEKENAELDTIIE
jgi:hypothetical protein